MKTFIQFERRTLGGLIHSDAPGSVFPEWQDEEETWLFLAPHDDDIVCGAGITFLAALEKGVRTHAGVVSTGEMGYCREEFRTNIAEVRMAEAKASFTAMGLPEECLHFLQFPDGSLHLEAGRRFAGAWGRGDQPSDIAGASGLSNALTHLFRKTRPTRVFLPSATDLHPDHRAVHQETIISLFHAQGGIWPELGEPLAAVPAIYEYATYSDFASPPTMRVRGDESLLEKKLDGIAQYKSQEQIEIIIQVQREAGPNEYLRELAFDIMVPGKYDDLFEE